MSNNFFEVLRAGINTTYQDRGRFYMQHLGVAPGGCMDLKAFLIANKDHKVKSISHITGGGLIDNIERFEQKFGSIKDHENPNIQLNFGPTAKA